MGSEINITDTLELTITNYGNDTLKFINITDLSTTEFETNFNLNDSLTGLMDYKFKIFYSPIDLIEDSVIFNIETNGGSISYLLKTHNTITSISVIDNIELSIYPNPATNNIQLTVNKPLNEPVQIIDITGKLVKQLTIEQCNSLSINIS